MAVQSSQTVEQRDQWTKLLNYLKHHEVVYKPIDVSKREDTTLQFNYKMIPLTLTIKKRLFSKYRNVTLYEDHYFQYQIDHSGILHSDFDWARIMNLFTYYKFQFGLNTNHCITYNALVDRHQLDRVLDHKIKEIVMIDMTMGRHLSRYLKPGIR